MDHNFVSVRVMRIKEQKAKFQFRHDMRQSIPSYADPNFTSERTTPIILDSGTPDEWRKDQEERYIATPKIAANGKKTVMTRRKLRKDSAWGVSGIITFGTDVNPTDDEIPMFDERAKQLVQHISDRWNVPIRYIVRHNDESHIHYHFFLDYVTRDGSKVLHKEFDRWENGREELRQLQDLAGEIFSDLGLRRGIAKEKRLAYIDKLKETGIEESLLRKIRTRLLSSKGLKDLHLTLEEDSEVMQYTTQKLEAVMNEMAEGRIPEKEDVAIVSAELAKTDIKKAMGLIEAYQSLRKSYEHLQSFEAPDYFSKLRQALEEGKPAPMPPTSEGKLWKRLETYIRRYNNALGVEEDLTKRVRLIENTISKLKQTEAEYTKGIEALERNKMEYEKKYNYLYDELKRIDETYKNLKTEWDGIKSVEEKIEKIHHKHKGMIKTDWDGFKRDIACLLRSKDKEIATLKFENHSLRQKISKLRSLAANLRKENKRLLSQIEEYFRNPQRLFDDLKNRLKRSQEHTSRDSEYQDWDLGM